jgi:SecD/SecF fusion protein
LGWSQVILTFKHKVSHDTLQEMIKDQFAPINNETDEREGVIPRFNLTAKDFKVGDSKAHDEWTVKMLLPPQDVKKAMGEMADQVKETPFFPASNTIGGRVATETQGRAIIALLASLVCIIGYIWIRFQKVMYGLAAVVALVHDVLITLGAIALTAYLAPYLGFLKVEEFKIGLSTLAAFLTIIGYSLNDTIVVFDRIREVRGKSPHLTGDMVNNSINQTLSRTLLTSLTTLIVVVILYFFGGQGIHSFAFALVIGVMVGTYSSIFVASPVLLWMSRTSKSPAK